MDGHRFDGFTRWLIASGSRRAALRAVAAGLLAGSLGWRGEPAAASHVVCALKANGERCTRGGECCSGRCARKRGSRKKFCRQAPEQGICTVVEDACVSSEDCNAPGTPQCMCFVTESGFSFCGRFPEQIPERCFICDSDADCERREGGQKGDRCVRCEGTFCSESPGNTGTVCISLCPNPRAA